MSCADVSASLLPSEVKTRTRQSHRRANSSQSPVKKVAPLRSDSGHINVGN
jgi:hypothetical protein